MDTFVAAIFFVLASAMGLLMLMTPGFAWFHLLTMLWPNAFRWSPLQLTLACIPLTLISGVWATWNLDTTFIEQSQQWLLSAVGSCLLQTPLLYWWSRR